MAKKEFIGEHRLLEIVNLIKSVFDKKQDTIWVGTKDEYEAQKASIPDGAHLIFTDDFIGGGGGSITIDEELDKTSSNAIANKAVAEAIETINDTIGQVNTILNGV